MENKFIPPCPLSTPVLFLIFNRPETTKKVFNEIKKAKPSQLFVAADGPRADKPGEKGKCEQARKIIEQIDWECEVKTLFRDKNLGCKLAVSSAIDWFFENVEEGIILEDDCLPAQSFFWFCQELIGKYREKSKIMHINGTNWQFGDKYGNNDYYFSKLSSVWGWATWKSAWKHYDVEMTLFPNFLKEKKIDRIFENNEIKTHFIKIFKKAFNDEVDTWDYQWYFARLLNRGISIFPNTNLVENIGFCDNSLHTKNLNDVRRFNQVHEIDFPLTHAKIITVNKKADNNLFEKVYKLDNLKKAKRFLKKYIPPYLIKLYKSKLKY
jgi:hypothetical protein